MNSARSCETFVASDTTSATFSSLSVERPVLSGGERNWVGHKYSARRSKPLIRRPCRGEYGKLGVKQDETSNLKREPIGKRGSGKVLKRMGLSGGEKGPSSFLSLSTRSRIDE